MKRITLIHTVIPTLISYIELLKQSIGNDVIVNDIYDGSFAAVDHRKSPEQLYQERFDRLYLLARAAQNNTDILIIACSTLSVEAQALKPLFAFPVVAIDDAMFRAAVTKNKRICLFATSSNPVEPCKRRLTETASEMHMQAPQIDVVLCEEALPFLITNNLEEVRSISLSCLAEHTENPELILLAQGSSGFMKNDIEECCKCEVMSALPYLFEEIKTLL